MIDARKTCKFFIRQSSWELFCSEFQGIATCSHCLGFESKTNCCYDCSYWSMEYFKGKFPGEGVCTKLGAVKCTKEGVPLTNYDEVCEYFFQAGDYEMDATRRKLSVDIPQKELSEKCRVCCHRSLGGNYCNKRRSPAICDESCSDFQEKETMTDA